MTVKRALLLKYLPDMQNFHNACGEKDGFVRLSSSKLNMFLKHVPALSARLLQNSGWPHLSGCIWRLV